MFCKQDQYYKGYAKGIQDGISQSSDKNNCYFILLNTCIAIGTLVGAFFTYHTWQDSKYSSKIDNAIDVYYGIFIPSMSQSRLTMLQRAYTFEPSIAPKTVNEHIEKKYLLEDQIDSSASRVISSLRKIKPYLSQKLVSELEKFLGQIKDMKDVLSSNALKNSIDNSSNIPNKKIEELNEDFDKLMNKIRDDLLFF